MSRNLTLRVPKGERYGLWQTPTVVTDAILAARDRRAAYFAWLDAQDAEPLAVNAHRQGVVDFIREHPGAVWGEE